jgi:exodeoxyribonuclease-3
MPTRLAIIPAMKIASWNVNSVRARFERLERWLASRRPDILCLQELKATEADFPFEKLRAAGYEAAMHGQKTYNGVAILARGPLADVERGFGDGGDETQSRLVAARVGGFRVVSVYVPNGQEVGSEKWAYKLDWLRRLRGWLDRATQSDEPFVICGDFNVAPEARDVHDPATWEPTTLYHPDARAALAAVTAWGLRDTFRLHHADGGLYSWWDYRMLAFPKDHGLRIDHIFANEAAARRCTAASIDREERKGTLPSDHAPVIAEFRDPGAS